jgi:16S rRNA (uracil1498-N3)-methyltransferase
MLRVFNELWDGGFELPDLSDEEAHHLVRVRRVRPGEAVQVLNGRGHLGRGQIAQIEGSAVQIELDAIQRVDPPHPQVTLVVGLPKGKVFPSLLHRAVELGASEIIPLLSDHSEITNQRGVSKQERWQSVLIEAVKQSGNPHLPHLHAPLSLDAALAHTEQADRIVLGLVSDVVPLQRLLPTLEADRVALFIGPEGDFSCAEYERLRAAGSLLASLGPLVLKVETAAIVALGIVQLCRARLR